MKLNATSWGFVLMRISNENFILFETVAIMNEIGMGQDPSMTLMIQEGNVVCWLKPCSLCQLRTEPSFGKKKVFPLPTFIRRISKFIIELLSKMKLTYRSLCPGPFYFGSNILAFHYPSIYHVCH